MRRWCQSQAVASPSARARAGGGPEGHAAGNRDSAGVRRAISKHGARGGVFVIAVIGVPAATMFAVWSGSFDTAAITIASVELLHCIKLGQFKVGRMCLKDGRASRSAEILFYGNKKAASVEVLMVPAQIVPEPRKARSVAFRVWTQETSD